METGCEPLSGPHPVFALYFPEYRVHEGQSLRGDLAARDRFRHRAARLRIVAAVAEAAMPEERADVDERSGQVVRGQVREAEYLHARRVDDPRFGVENVERRRR